MRLRDRPVAVLTWLRDRGLVMPLAVLVAALMLFVSEGGYQRTRGSLDAAIEAAQARLTLHRLLGLVTRAESAFRKMSMMTRSGCGDCRRRASSASLSLSAVPHTRTGTISSRVSIRLSRITGLSSTMKQDRVLMSKCLGDVEDAIMVRSSGCALSRFATA